VSESEYNWVSEISNNKSQAEEKGSGIGAWATIKQKELYRIPLSEFRSNESITY
jgi:hypothetical protein